MHTEDQAYGAEVMVPDTGADSALLRAHLLDDLGGSAASVGVEFFLLADKPEAGWFKCSWSPMTGRGVLGLLEAPMVYGTCAVVACDDLVYCAWHLPEQPPVTNVEQGNYGALPYFNWPA